VDNIFDSGNTTIRVTVYAQFQDVCTAGYLQQGNPEPVAQAQATTTSPFSPMTSPAPVPGDQADKSKDGLITSLVKASPLGPIVKSVPILSNTVDMLSSFIKTTLSVLDKPTDLRIAQKMQQVLMEDFPKGAGLDSSNRLSLYPNSSLATKSVFPNTFDTSRTITNLAATPMLHDYFSFDAAHTRFYMGVTPGYLGYYQYNGSPTVFAQPDFLLYAFNCHRFWRGSINYLIFFNTSAYTTARMRISYIYDGSVPGTASGGDFPSKVIDIKGNTTVKLNVPFLWDRPYRSTIYGYEGVSYEPALVFDLLTLPNAGAVSAPYISMVMYRAGGQDTQFQGLVSGANMTTQLGRRVVQAQTSVVGEFSSPFQSMTCESNVTMESGYVSSETTGRIIDTMRRFVLHDDTVGNFPVPTSSDYTLKLSELYYYFGSLFKYMRGSVRYKFIVTSSSSPTYPLFVSMKTNSVANTDAEGSAGQVPILASAPFAQVEIPYFSSVCYLPMRGESYFRPGINEFPFPNIPNTLGTTYVAAGDDFQMFYLLPPNDYTYPSEQKTKNTKTIQNAKSSSIEVRKPVLGGFKT